MLDLQRDKQLSKFVAQLAHRFRTPRLDLVHAPCSTFSITNLHNLIVETTHRPALEHHLIVLYRLTRRLLAEGRRRPLAKFAYIKILVATVV